LLIFFFTFLGVLIVFRYAEFRNDECFPLARTAFSQSENENPRKSTLKMYQSQETTYF